MLSGFVELLLRIATVYLLPRIMGPWGVYLADPVGWIGAALLLGGSYAVANRKILQAESKEC